MVAIRVYTTCNTRKYGLLLMDVCYIADMSSVVSIRTPK